MTIQPFPRENADFIAQAENLLEECFPTPTAGTWPGSK